VLLDAVRDFPLPAGDGYVWAAGEASAIRESAPVWRTGVRQVSHSRLGLLEARRGCGPWNLWQGL